MRGEGYEIVDLADLGLSLREGSQRGKDQRSLTATLFLNHEITSINE
jgi:hypothetical protein